jgi:hypothetical protein
MDNKYNKLRSKPFSSRLLNALKSKYQTRRVVPLNTRGIEYPNWFTGNNKVLYYSRLTNNQIKVLQNKNIAHIIYKHWKQIFRGPPGKVVPINDTNLLPKNTPPKVINLSRDIFALVTAVNQSKPNRARRR